MNNLHWRYKVLGCALLLVGFCVLGYYTRTPKLNPDQPDNSAQQYRDDLNQRIGQEAYNRLREKYGDQ